MAWAPLRRFLSSKSRPEPVGALASLALALEAGANHLARVNPALAARVRLVSVRGGVLHAVCLSAAAAHELSALREGLFQAMRASAPVTLTDLRTEVRGNLAAPESF